MSYFLKIKIFLLLQSWTLIILQFQRYFIPQAELEEAFIYIIHKPIDFSYRLKTFETSKSANRNLVPSLNTKIHLLSLSELADFWHVRRKALFGHI